MERFLQSLIVLMIIVGITEAGTTGKLTGKVTDSATGDGLPFVNIVLDGTVIGAATDIDGHYVILNIQPGKYTVRAQYIGYQSQIVENVVISIDRTTVQDFILSEASIELGAVIVEAKQDVIKKDITSSQSLISADDIENLPVTELDDVLQLQSGVTKGANGDFHIRGGRTSEISYTVNGISVTDSYDNSRGIEIDNSSIQELQVISGTFNAEYGNAMSGIINAVTKEGSNEYKGLVKIYSSDYATDRKNVFANIEDINPVANHNLQASLSGPIPFTDKKVSFFVNARYDYDDGWLYGYRKFTPTGDSADGEAVPMNWSKRLIGQGNIAYVANSNFKFNFEFLYSKEDFQDYNEDADHEYKYNPDGEVNKFFDNFTGTFTITHTLSSSSFYTLKGSVFNREFNEYLYENPLDSRYLHPDSLNRESNFEFRKKGTNLHRFYRLTNTAVGKFDFTSQASENHLVKLGVETKFHTLEVDDYNLQPKRDASGAPIEPFVPDIPTETAHNRNIYSKSPFEVSAYMQDKIEFENVIINLGFRLDYLDSKGKVLVDMTDPNIYLPLRSELQNLSIEEREPYFYKDATVKWQLSPRFGIAYPISASGVVHFSYGHFLQVPTFQYLFNRAAYKVPLSGTPGDVYGNPDLEPQKTIQYEIGFRHEFFDLFVIDITSFYKDVRDWITSSAAFETMNGVPYAIYINKDYANIKGIALNLKKQYSDNYQFDINYTYQVAEGSNSRPEEEFEAQRSEKEPSLFLVPLDWDQRHLLNASLFIGSDTWGGSLIARYGTGLPYSPSITQVTSDRGISSGLERNSRRRPLQFSLDLRLHKTFDLIGVNLTAFLQIFNLLDNDVVQHVFGDSGKPDFTTEGNNVGEAPDAVNTVEEYLVRPWYYGEPRRIQFGIDISL